MYQFPRSATSSPHYGLMPARTTFSTSTSDLDAGYRSDESGTTVDINEVQEELNRPLHATFQVGETVFVRIRSNSDDPRWYQGVVRKVLPSESPYSKRRRCKYVVVFRRNIKATFDPLEGNMKPFTPEYQAHLLRWRRYFGENAVTFIN